MLLGIDYGSMIESSTHATIRNGRQQSLGRNVVIVELDAHAAQGAAVSSEIAWWQLLRNPHLVEIITAVRTEEGLTLVLDQAACLPLRSVPRLDPPAQALVVCQTLQALACIHEAGHAHGNVGLDAVLLDNNGLARLAVPGLARSATAFHAPELAHTAQRTANGDVYAAGKVLEHLAGRDAQRWAPIITVATAGSPGERYESATDMYQAIDNVMNEAEGRDWTAVALAGLAAAATSLLVAVPAGTSAGSIAVSGTSAGAPLPPPLPPPTAMPAPGPAPLVQLRARSSLQRIKGLRLIAVGGAAVSIAALVAGLVVFNTRNTSRTAAPTTTVSPPTSAVASSPTTASPTPAPFDPNALPRPITTTPDAKVWTAPAGMTVADSTVAGDVVVVVLTDLYGTATAVGLRDGVEVWRHPLPAVTGMTIGTLASVITTDDAVIVAYNFGQTLTTPGGLGLTSLGAVDGTERWSQRLDFAGSFKLLHGPGNIIVVGATLLEDAQPAAIDSTDGHLLWDINTAHVVGSVIDVRNDRVVVANGRGNVSNVVDIHSGQVLFKTDGQAARLAEPVLYTMNGGLRCEDPDCVLEGHDASTGAIVWHDPDQTGALLGVSRDGDAIVHTYKNGSNADVHLTAIRSDGTTRWTAPPCGGGEVAATDAGILMYCREKNSLVLYDNATGAEVQTIHYETTSSNALAADGTVYTVVGPNVTATTLGADGTALWSAPLPSGFAPYGPLNKLDYQVDSAARAFDHVLLIKGRAADGRAALVVLTERAT